MGLLDIWSDWKKDNQSQSNGFEDYTSTNGGTLDTAGGGQPTNPINTMLNRKDQKPTGQFDFNPLKEGKTNLPQWMLSDQAKKNQAALIQQQGTPKGEMMPADNEEPSTQISGAELSKDSGFMSKLANMAGVDMKQAGANWKDKGGFEGLMSNPAFSLGLALMQSSANGKTINQGILDNFVKSAKISSEFKDRIEARKEEPIQATAADISETKDLLKAMNIEEGNWFENFGSKVKSVFTGKGGNPGLEWDTAVEEISLQYQIKVKAAQNALKQAGKNQVLRKTDKIRIMNKLVEEQKIKRNKSMTGGLFTADTLKNSLPNKAQGGPVSQGQPYVVGEKGPEIIIPHSSGNVLSNDDSQIYAMLLASNPQLQKVSRQRAEKVLRNRFPEYFEG
jgi:hypothetical protein